MRNFLRKARCWFGKEAADEAPGEVMLGDPFLRCAGDSEPDPETVTRMPPRWRMWVSAFGLGWLCGREMAERK